MGVAAIMENKKLFKNKKVETVVFGGNIDSRIFVGILNCQLARDGKIAKIRIDTAMEWNYFTNDGILNYVLKNIASR